MSKILGIEKLRVWPGTLALDFAELARERGLDPEHLRKELLVDERSLNPPWEDAVTMAVNAAAPLLTDEDRERIEVLIVGTETAVDMEKPISSWVHRFLDLRPECRNYEIKHACYAGTAALQTALAWLASGLLSPGAKALVINSDQSLPGLGERHETVLGCGAAAILLSEQPDFLQIELGQNGVYATEISDVVRPTGRIEMGNNELSLFSYMEGVQGAYDAYEDKVGPVDFESHFAANIYHAPFGGITFRAHKSLLSRDRAIGRDEAWEHYSRRTLPSLKHNRRIGSTYGATTFVAMLGLIDSRPDLQPGDRVGVYAYGSGSCAEFYTALVGPGAQRVAEEANLGALLERRRMVDVPTYEAAERERDGSVGACDFSPTLDAADGWYQARYSEERLLVLCGIEGYMREYGWSDQRGDPCA